LNVTWKDIKKLLIQDKKIEKKTVVKKTSFIRENHNSELEAKKLEIMKLEGLAKKYPNLRHVSDLLIIGEFEAKIKLSTPDKIIKNFALVKKNRYAKEDTPNWVQNRQTARVILEIYSLIDFEPERKDWLVFLENGEFMKEIIFRIDNYTNDLELF
jgi:hypothetical protein